MQKMWCWRCKMELAMLDDDEFAIAVSLYSKALRTKGTRSERFKEMLDYYNNLTGENETEPNAIMHHSISQYGPPCENCTKPYRTPKASFCAGCGHKRPPSEIPA